MAESEDPPFKLDRAARIGDGPLGIAPPSGSSGRAHIGHRGSRYRVLSVRRGGLSGLDALMGAQLWAQLYSDCTISARGQARTMSLGELRVECDGRLEQAIGCCSTPFPRARRGARSRRWQ